MKSLFTPDRLAEIARSLLNSEKSAEQVIVACSETGTVYTLLNRDVLSGAHTDEEQLIRQLLAAEDTHLRYIVCMWNNFSLDLPSMYLRTRLLEIDPQNTAAQILLDNHQKPWMRTIKATMPNQK